MIGSRIALGALAARLVPCLMGSLLFAVPARIALAESLTEDFTTTTFRDPVHTTADWNTSDGELKLFPFDISLAGSYDTPSLAVGTAVSGDLAFVADFGSGLEILNVSDPAVPTLVGSYDTPGLAVGIAVYGNRAFVADYGAGLHVIDISNPAIPTLIGSYDTPGNAWAVAVAGDHVFVADEDAGLQVIDISDPAVPSLVASYDTPGFATGIAVASDLAYIADLGGGLQVIDISDPAAPTLAGSYNTPGQAHGVAVAGNLAFVADFNTGLQVIDISNPAAPTLAGSYNTPSQARGIAVAGDLAFVADDDSGLQVIDISDPTAPTLAGSYNTPGSAFRVAVDGELVFVGDYEGGLQIVDVLDPVIPPVFTGSLDTPDLVLGVAVDGDQAVIVDRSSGLMVIDISDPADPTLLGSYDTPGNASGVAVDGNLALVADDRSGLQVIDISNPAAPTLLGSYDTPGEARGVAMTGDLAFVADYSSGLQLIDISDPASPTLAGSYDTPGIAHSVVVEGDLAFVADYSSGLLVIDISDPTSPVLAGSYDTPGSSTWVELEGDLAFVADLYSGLQVIDISDPANPTLVGSYDTSDEARGVAVAGDFAFLANSFGGLLVIDISDPATPTLVSTYETPDLPDKVTVAGELAFVADRNGGLQVIGVFQGDVASSPAAGQSLALEEGVGPILKARLSSTQNGRVSWELSADAGVNWQAVDPDNEWNRFDVPGDELVWRNLQTWSTPGLNPTVSSLTIDWLHDFGTITSITDVPDDQGGRVEIHFTRSAYDFVDETELAVVGYAIYRRVDDEPRAERVREEGLVPDPDRFIDSHLASYGADRVRLLDDREFVLGDPGFPLGEESARGSGFPPGVWEGAGWILPAQSDEYTASVLTAVDSTGVGDGRSVFLTATHTTIPSIWFASPPDSGYSVDNIPPGIPTGLTLDGPDLSWDTASEPDFEYHTVYGSSMPDLDETATLLGYTTEPTYDVNADPFGYYHVTTSDRAGNESGEASVENGVSGVPGGEAAAFSFVLRGAQPNPFRGSTTISYDLSETLPVRLAIYDATGRRVRTIFEGTRSAGSYSDVWDGRTDTGQAVSRGVYLARMTAGELEASRRVVVLEGGLAGRR